MKYLITLTFLIISCLSYSQDNSVNNLYKPNKFKKVVYYKTGEIREIYNVDLSGKRHGKFYSFFEDGTLWGVGYHKHGKKHGEWKLFNRDKSMNGIHVYDKNKKVGHWIIYDSGGDFLAEKYF
jgi:antitoxin component YwqK of YwqJK toxin-antitoxin module